MDIKLSSHIKEYATYDWNDKTMRLRIHDLEIEEIYGFEDYDNVALSGLGLLIDIIVHEQIHELLSRDHSRKICNKFDNIAHKIVPIMYGED